MRVGDELPDLEARLSNGEKVWLARMMRPVVILFYPKAMSVFCTMEACHVRDLSAEFRTYNAFVIGVTGDGPTKVREFEESHALSFPSVSDSDRTVAKAFGACGPFGILKRLTVVADANGQVVLYYLNALNPKAHAERALGALAGLSAS